MDLFGIYRICLRIDRTLLSIRNGFTPCVLCVYERLAMVGLFIAGIIGALALARLLSAFLLLLWVYSVQSRGLMISIRHLDLQMNPAPVETM